MKIVIISIHKIISSSLAAQSGNQYNLSKGLAIQGYDPVAYFNQTKAVKGTLSFSHIHNGVKYQFVNAENKNEFIKNPAKYDPKSGGWCAYAMGATGEKVEIDPEKFKITDGRLFLFYHSWTNNTLSKCNKDEKNLKHKADLTWKILLSK